MTQRRTFIISILLACTLPCESAQKTLKSLDDLKGIAFGQSVPKHSLLLLHWFANVIDIDNNNILHLTFDPDSEEFGSHHYGNFEAMLDPPPWGCRYFTVGNLNELASDELPGYVHRPPVREYEGTNMDRIIFRVQEANSGVQRIDQVYLTQHYRQHEQQGTRYNPEYTYRISPSLLQQIQCFSVQDNHRSLRDLRDWFQSNAEEAQLTDITNTWGRSLAILGLLLFIVIQEKHSKSKPIRHRQPSVQKRNPRPDYVVDMPDECHPPLLNPYQSDQLHLKVITRTNGQATIVWKNVSRRRLIEGVAVVLFKPQKDGETRVAYKLIQTTDGHYDTSVSLTEGLQARLHIASKSCFFWTKVKEEIFRGPIFSSPEAVVIRGYNAILQLFVKDGEACARLYVHKSFRHWKSEFKHSWVGFYESELDDTRDYKWWRWQWATKFQQGPDAGDYSTHEYCSGMTIAPKVQARFVLNDYNEIARSPTWE